MIHASYPPLWSFEQGGQFLLPLLQTGGERGTLVRTQATVALGWVARSQAWTQTTWSGRSAATPRTGQQKQVRISLGFHTNPKWSRVDELGVSGSRRGGTRLGGWSWLGRAGARPCMRGYPSACPRGKGGRWISSVSNKLVSHDSKSGALLH